MKSIQEIYKNYGQYDRIVVLTLRDNSTAKTLYGNSITGMFHYSQKDRRCLENNNFVSKSNPAVQKIHIILKEGIDSENIKKAFIEGIELDEIVDILYLPKPGTNEFVETKERNLPEPTEIKIDDKGNMNLVMIGFYQRRIENGEELLESEKDKYSALLMIYKPDQIDLDFEEEYIKDEMGEVKKSILYEKYHFEYSAGEEAEITKEYQDLIGWKINGVKENVYKQLRRVGIASKKELSQNRWLISFLIENGVKFTPEIFLYTNPLVYMNYESWLHIFLKHAKPLMIGKHVQSRTPFQYALTDVFQLLRILIDIIEDEIKDHYSVNGKKEYTRNGLYYQGDYYKIKISAQGRVETIFKIQKNHH